MKTVNVVLAVFLFIDSKKSNKHIAFDNIYMYNTPILTDYQINPSELNANIPLTRRESIMEIFNSEAYSKYVLSLFNNDTKQNREAIAEAFGTSDWKDLHEEFGEKPYESVQDFYDRHQGMIFDYLSDQRDLEWNNLIKFFRDQKDYVIVADLGT